MPDVLVLTKWAQLENGDWTPQVALDYPGEWSDATSQSHDETRAGLDRYLVRGRISAAQLSALQADARYAVLPEGADLDAAQVTALKAKLGAALSGDMADLVTESAKPGDIVAGVLDVVTRPPWRVGQAVKVGEVYYYAGNLYRVVQAHTTQADWTPNVTPALWVRFHEVSEGPQPWQQPAGAHDAYQLGAHVTHNGHEWESLIPDNVWEPGAPGTEALWRQVGA